eukprot:NP_497301.2 F-box A protein [Caenorhabditis elegans]
MHIKNCFDTNVLENIELFGTDINGQFESIICLDQWKCAKVFGLLYSIFESRRIEHLFHFQWICINLDSFPTHIAIKIRDDLIRKSTFQGCRIQCDKSNNFFKNKNKIIYAFLQKKSFQKHRQLMFHFHFETILNSELTARNITSLDLWKCAKKLHLYDSLLENRQIVHLFHLKWFEIQLDSFPTNIATEIRDVRWNCCDIGCEKSKSNSIEIANVFKPDYAGGNEFSIKYSIDNANFETGSILWFFMRKL